MMTITIPGTLALAILLAVLMSQALPAVAAPADPKDTRCKVRGVVVIIIGQASREVSEFGHSVSNAMSRYPCYSVRDVTDSLEAGMGEGLSRLDVARDEAEKGLESFLAMRLAEARGHFKRATQAYSDGFAYLPYAGRYADALMYLGATEAALGDRGSAIRSFRAALRLRPDADPGDYSALPDVVKAFEEAGVLAGSDAVGALIIDSEPPGAEVFLDGTFTGVTPMDLPEMPAGPHWVVLQKTGFVRKALAIDVPARGSTAVLDDQGTLIPARRKPLYDMATRKLAGSGEMESTEAIEDLKALFLSDMALVVRVVQTGDGMMARLSFWDLTTMQRLWSGTEPRTGTVSYLGRGAAESLVSRAISVDEKMASVQEGGAATLLAKKGVWWKQWWFWTVIGGGVVGGTVAAAVLTRSGGSSPGIPKDGTGAVIIRY